MSPIKKNSEGNIFSWVWPGKPSHAKIWQDLPEVFLGDTRCTDNFKILKNKM